MTAVQKPTVYKYEAVSPDGKRVKGSQAKMTAYSEEAVRQALLADGYTPLSITAVADRGLNADLGAMFGDRDPKLKPVALAAFSRQLHQLLKAGIQVSACMRSLAENPENKGLSRICSEIAVKIEAGVPMAAAFADYPRTFDEVFVSYLAAGEATGSLVETTERLAKMVEKRAKLSLKIKGVTAYPKMVAGVIVLLVGGILKFLVPQYAEIYANFGSELPAPTAFVMRLSENMTPVRFPFFPLPLPVPNLWSPVLWFLVIFFGVRYFLKQTKDNVELGAKIDRFKYRLPLFGKLAKTATLFRWTSTLAGALHSGLMSQDALTLAGRASGCRWIQSVTPELIENLRTGRKMSDGLIRHPDLFPPGIRTMITSGEETGEVAEMLESASESLDDEVSAMTEGLGAKIEVGLFIVLGLVVGSLLVVLYLPLLNLSSTVGEGMQNGSSGAPPG